MTIAGCTVIIIALASPLAAQVMTIAYALNQMIP